MFGLAALTLLTLGAPGGSQAPGLAMLDQIEPGRWEIRLRDGTRPSYPLCLSSAWDLIQLRHPDQACERLTVTDRPDQVTVQYTCKGRGYGRTTIRRETARLMQIETQGIAEGLPFSFAAEARRTGSCAR